MIKSLVRSEVPLCRGLLEFAETKIIIFNKIKLTGIKRCYLFKNLLFYWLFLKQKHLISNKMSKIADFTCKIIRAFLFLKYRSSFYVHFYVTRKWKNKSLTIELVTQVSNPLVAPSQLLMQNFQVTLKSQFRSHLVNESPASPHHQHLNYPAWRWKLLHLP